MTLLHFWKKAMLLFKVFTTGIDWDLKKRESKLQNIAYELLDRIYRPNKLPEEVHSICSETVWYFLSSTNIDP